VESLQHWTVWDNARDPYNLSNKTLLLSHSNPETVADSLSIDILSNGVKHKSGHVYSNISGIKYLYLAIAEETFKHARGR